MAKKERWVIFDADNTLWDIEYLYDDARKAFCKYALDTLNLTRENPGDQVTLDILDKAQRHRDIQLHKTHGYSSSRFARSFEDTLMFFMQYAPLEAIIHVRHVAQEVFEKPVRVVDNLESILLRLSHKYSLAIITAGERWVQEKRLKEFHLSNKFKQKLIVERKTPDVFGDFCKGNKVSPGRCWVVGDSVRSDIGPATKAGLRAIHIQAANWAAEHEELPRRVQSVRALKDILRILL
jgi:putative hydrolase of the HAD superfamily